MDLQKLWGKEEKNHVRIQREEKPGLDEEWIFLEFVAVNL